MSIFRTFVFILLMCAGSFAKAQHPFLKNGLLIANDSTFLLVDLSAYRNDGSNALNRLFLEKMAFGGFISDDLKSSISDKTESSNFYEGSMQPQVNFVFFPSKENNGISLGYSYNSHSYAQFSDDFFNLVFNGNGAFLNQTADLSDAKAYYQSYHALRLGWVSKQTGTSVSVSLFKGDDLIETGLGKAGVQTSIENIFGEIITTETNISVSEFSYLRAHSSESNMGFGINAVIPWRIKLGLVLLSFEDIGIIKWNNTSRADTSGSYNFTGFLWDINETDNVNGFFSPLVDSLNPARREETLWRATPGNISARFITKSFYKCYFLDFRVSYRYAIGYNPNFAMSINKSFGLDNTLWLSGQIGGFTNYQFGMGTQLRFLESSYFTLGSHFLPSLISSNSRGFNLFFQYSLRI